MAKVGYIFKANSYDALDADKEWMRQYGCVQVVEEECAHEALRPQWKQLMASLGRGDELVVAKFSNAVRDLRGLAALVELCRIKVVRLVSIHDKIDTLGELFPDTTAAQVLEMFGALPEEVAVLRKSSSHIMQLQQTIKPPVTKKAMSSCAPTSSKRSSRAASTLPSTASAPSAFLTSARSASPSGIPRTRTTSTRARRSSGITPRA